MSGSRSEHVVVTHASWSGPASDPPGWSVSERHDQLIVEEPMSIRLDGALVSTTMRTPGHDHELAVGFCVTEGLLDGHPITDVRYCLDEFEPGVPNEFNAVSVDTAGLAPAPTQRLGNVSSSCGWCGREQLDELVDRLTPLAAPGPVDLDLLADVPSRVQSLQDLFTATGAVHAAAAFDPDGSIVIVREDVGRHNAVDKVVGALTLGTVTDRAAGSPAPGAGLGLFVSGRASIEMVQKAWAAGFHTLVAVSAPTSLAVAAARRGNLVLAGFVRAGSGSPDRAATLNVYAPEHVDRA